MSKKVIVFGGAGFVGSRLCPILQEQYDLTIVDTFWFWDSVEEYREKVGITAKCIQEDTRDKSISRIINNADAVVNLSCLSNDTSSDINYNFTHDVSYNGVMNVINNCIRKKRPRSELLYDIRIYRHNVAATGNTVWLLAKTAS